MFKITLKNILKCRDNIKELLGAEFINFIEEFETIGLNWSESIRTETKAHPFAILWRAFNQEIEKSIVNDSIELSEQSLRVLDLSYTLNKIKNLSNFERILNSIKEKDTFYSACFEAFIVANYHNKGYKIEIPRELPEKGIRTNDLTIKFNNENVYVECKNLDDIQIKESPQWKELQNRLSKALVKYRRSWEINIFASKQINGREKDLLYQRIIKDLKNNNLNKKLNFSKFKVEYSKLAEWDKEIIGNIEFEKKSDLLHMGFEFSVQNGIPTYRNIHKININSYVEKDITNKIIGKIKNARGQIPNNGPGIIHIAIPYKIGSQLIEVIDKAYSSIFEVLNKHSKRINAAVISSIVFVKNYKFPYVYNHYVIPNMQTSSDLPSNFSILGTNNLNVPLPDVGWKIEFDFMIFEDWEKDRPNFIFDNSTNDGKYQLRVWRTWNNKFRMDFVSPSIGRVFIESNSIKLDKNKEYKFCGTCTLNELKIYIDKTKIGFTKFKKS